MKLLEKIIYLKYALFLRFCLSVYFEPLLGWEWECAYVCCNLGTEKEGIYNRENVKQTITIKANFILEKKHPK